MNDRPLIKKQQVEVVDVVADDQIAPDIKTLELLPEGAERAGFIEVKPQGAAIPAKHALLRDDAIGLDDQADAQHAPLLGAERQLSVLLIGARVAAVAVRMAALGGRERLDVQKYLFHPVAPL